jgi:hypothetical protein
MSALGASGLHLVFSQKGKKNSGSRKKISFPSSSTLPASLSKLPIEENRP